MDGNRTCGDYGGRNEDGEPCELPPNWGRSQEKAEDLDGRCRWHPANGMRRLTPKEERFVQEYLVDLNATQAAVRAGYGKSVETAASIGWENLQKPAVERAIREAAESRARKLEISQERVARELARIGLGSIKDLVEWDDDGRPLFKPSRELTDDEAAQIKSLEFKVTKEGDRKVKLKTHSKAKALELLGKHLDMFSERIDVTVRPLISMEDPTPPTEEELRDPGRAMLPPGGGGEEEADGG